MYLVLFIGWCYYSPVESFKVDYVPEDSALLKANTELGLQYLRRLCEFICEEHLVVNWILQAITLGTVTIYKFNLTILSQRQWLNKVLWYLSSTAEGIYVIAIYNDAF